MSDGLTTFADDKDGYPGRISRVGNLIDWSAIRDASYLKEAAQNTSKVSASHSSAASYASSATIGTDSHSNGATTDTQLEKDDPVASNRSRPNSASTRNSDASQGAPLVTVLDKLQMLLAEPTMNLEATKKIAWSGIPSAVRAPVWKVLMGYVPTNRSRRADTLKRKRSEYKDAVQQLYPAAIDANNSNVKSWERTDTYNRVGHQEDVTMHQISVDIPRTCPGQALFHIPEVQQALQRILYIWATRHPASGYVQGMNDLVTPFVYVFLAENAKNGCESSILQMSDFSAVEDAENSLANAEADAYWCLTALLNDIQDYYTFAQPGIQRRVHYLRELVARVDSHLCTHLEEQGLDFLQFAFRWMNCLLMRELPFPLIVRVWDTYLAEADGFAMFHVYVCAAILVSFSEELQGMDFQDLVMFLQNLPTESWTSKEIDVILSQAYMWRTIFGAAPSHLQ